MPADLSTLTPEFRNRFEDLIAECSKVGIEMRPYFSLRTPEQQARLWRQSRTAEEIAPTIQWLEQSGAPFLAKVLDKVGSQAGPHVTNALPGFSWHQWGEAVDCFWVVDNGAEWSATKMIDGQNGYRVYAAKAEALGLNAGGHWKSLREWPHVQLRKAASPNSAGLTLAEINQKMEKKFG